MGFKTIEITHNWSDEKVNDDVTAIYRQCKDCGTIEIIETFEGYECDEHTPAEAVQENVVDASCTEEGSYEEVVYCAVCGTELSRDAKSIEVAEHIPAEAVTENVTAENCGEDGSYEEVVYCSVCEAELSRETKTLVATGEHTWNDGEITTEPTEEAEGVKTYTCGVCGETKTESIPVLEHTHNHEAVVTAPTCEDAGYTTYTCACGDTYTADEVEALGHNYTYTVVNGKLVKVCSRCENAA